MTPFRPKFALGRQTRRSRAPLLAAALSAGALVQTGCPASLDFGGPARTSPALRNFDSCAALETGLRDNLKAEYAAMVRRSEWHSPMNFGGIADDVAVAAPEASAGGRQEGRDYSGTNNQEAGVDEADIVKTDGHFIYTLTRGSLEILGVPAFGQLNHASTTLLEGQPANMLLDGDRLVVMSQVYTWNLPEGDPLRALTMTESTEDYPYPRYESLTKLTVLDVTDRTAPTVEREVYVEGTAQTGRKVDSTVRMVTYAHMDIPGLQTWVESTPFPFDHGRLVNARIAENNALIDAAPIEELLPRLYERTGSTITPHTITAEGCTNFAVAEDGAGRGFTSIFSLDLAGEAFSFQADHVMTNQPTVYASTDTMLIAEPSNDWWWFWGRDDQEEATNIHRFDIQTAGETTYTGSGRVPGLVQGQFSLSEHDGDVRVATTTGTWNRWWLDEALTEPQVNHVYVLQGADALTEVGHVGGIAPDERIWSARFVGDKAYLVTFRQVDPLFTIDLSDATNPRIIGELKIDGVSTYIHPLESDRLLTIGYGGDENGLDWTTEISMFDVSDFARPSLESRLGLTPTDEAGNWNWSSSEALHEHKAFQYWGPQAMLAVPLSTWQETRRGNDWRYEYVSKLALVNVEAGQPLTTYGAVDHSALFNDGPNRWWGGAEIRRSIFMGDYIYAVGETGVTATHVETMERTATVRIDVPEANDGHVVYD